MVKIQERNTIDNILKWAINTLKDCEIEGPNITAEILLAFVLSCDRLNLHTNPERIVRHEDFTTYKKVISERAKHTPLQYITGHTEFMSLDFIVDKRVLIPRPETELLVETVLNKAKSKSFPNETITIMDIGTGSGNISISLAAYLENVQIFASDISKKALEVTIINARKHKAIDRIFILHGDLFEAFENHLEKRNADFIVSNPPYVEETELIKLEPEVRDHEPHKALIAGRDGLCFYKQIIKEAPEWLKPGGFLVMEMGETQARIIMRLIEREGRFDNIEIFKDLQGIERVISAELK